MNNPPVEAKRKGLTSRRPAVYYIENTGGEKLQNTLVHEKDANSVAIVEHPSMKCVNLANQTVERHLWEVPFLTYKNCLTLVGKDGVGFRVYVGWHGEMPRERPLPGASAGMQGDPFRAARRTPGYKAAGQVFQERARGHRLTGVH